MNAATEVTVDVHLPPGGPLSGMAADVRAGLTKPFKELSPRYFYDERGSQLFEDITALPEYYPTRCERSILESESDAICEAAICGSSASCRFTSSSRRVTMS